MKYISYVVISVAIAAAAAALTATGVSVLDTLRTPTMSQSQVDAAASDCRSKLGDPTYTQDGLGRFTAVGCDMASPKSLCKQAGGIPVFGWTGNMTNCIILPKK